MFRLFCPIYLLFFAVGSHLLSFFVGSNAQRNILDNSWSRVRHGSVMVMVPARGALLSTGCQLGVRFSETRFDILRKVSFGWIKHTSTKFIKNNQKILYFWRFDLYQRPSSEETGTRSSSSGSWRDKLVSSQESGRTYDWVGSSLRPGSWIVDWFDIPFVPYDKQ